MADRIGIMNDGVLQQVRHADRGLPRPGQPVRRPVRRQPDHERADCRCEHRRDDHVRAAAARRDEPFVLRAALRQQLAGRCRRRQELVLGIRPEAVGRARSRRRARAAPRRT